MQNTSKAGGLTPTTLAVWVCAADKVSFSVPVHTPTHRLTEYPPSLTNRKTDIARTYIVDF